MTKRKRTNNDLQNTTDWTTRTQLKIGATEGLAVPAVHVTSVVLLLNDTTTEGLAVPAVHVTSVVLLLNDTTTEGLAVPAVHVTVVLLLNDTTTKG